MEFKGMVTRRNEVDLIGVQYVQPRARSRRRTVTTIALALAAPAGGALKYVENHDQP